MRKGALVTKQEKKDGIGSLSVNYKGKTTFVSSAYVLQFQTAPSIALCRSELLPGVDDVAMSELSWKLAGANLAHEVHTRQQSQSLLNCLTSKFFFLFPLTR